MTHLAERSFEMVLRNRVRFGVGAIEGLPEVVAAAGGSRAFVVTDPGVRRAGVIDPILDRLAAAGIGTGLFDDIEPNPAASTVERGAVALRDFGLADSVLVAIGGGSAMDAAKAIDLRAANDRPLWELEYDGPDLMAGRPIVAVPTTAGTGAEAHSFAVITNEELGRKDYIGHPSLLAVTTILDPGLTVGLPPAVTAATGVDAMTHSLESLLSANPNPFAEAMALGVIRTVGTWLRQAVAEGSDLEARSQMLMASHLAGVGQASGTGVGLVHALGHSIGSRGRVAHGTALAAVLPEVLRFYIGTRDRELALAGIALGVASGAESESTAAGVAIGAIEKLLRDVDQRPTLNRLGLADDAAIDQLVTDTLDDAAIRNSPRASDISRKRGRSWSPSPADDRADHRLKTPGAYHPVRGSGPCLLFRVSKGSDGRRRRHPCPCRARPKPSPHAKLDRTRRSRTSMTRWGRHRPSAHRRCGPPTATQGHDERRGGRAGDAGGPRRIRRAHQCFGESHVRAREPCPPRHRPSAGRDPGGDRQSVARAATAARPGTVRGVAASDGGQRLL